MKQNNISIYPNNSYSKGLALNIASFLFKNGYNVRFLLENDKEEKRKSLSLPIFHSDDYSFKIDFSNIEDCDLFIYTSNRDELDETKILLASEQAFQLIRKRILEEKKNFVWLCVLNNERELEFVNKNVPSVRHSFVLEKEILYKMEASSISLFDFERFGKAIPKETRFYNEIIKLLTFITTEGEKY